MERMAVSRAGNRFDIIHQHGIWAANSRVTNRWRSRFSRPTIINPQGTLEDWALHHSRWKKRLAAFIYEQRNLRQASCLQAVAMSEVASFRKYGLTNPIAIIPNGISHTWLETPGKAEEFCKQHALPSEKRVALFLSRIHPKKGLPLLFEAIANMREHLEEWIVVIVGIDELNHQQELEHLAQQKQITDYVRFVGPAFGAHKANAFAAADLFVLPTHSEGLPVAALEALGAGIPVLTTHGTPFNELAVYGCGWWVPVSGVAIEQALREAVNLPQAALKQMGARGRELVRRHYTWSTIAEKTIELYSWLIYGGPPPSFVVMSM
jgi:glycosyltransferase involved in cell wall biosynthesis